MARLARSFAALFFAAVLLIASASVARGLAPIEDPSTTPWVFDGPSILDHQADVVDDIIAARTQDIAGERSLAQQANIPSRLTQTFSSFFDSAVPLAQAVDDIQRALADGQVSLRQSRPADALASARATLAPLRQARAWYTTIQANVSYSSGYFRVTAAPDGSALASAYARLKASTSGLGRLLDSLDKQEASLEAQAQAFKLKPLAATDLTIQTSAQEAFVGDTVELSGNLSSGNLPLPGRTVAITFNNVPVVSLVTDANGDYRGTLVVPTKYEPQADVRAIFSPEGKDAEAYLGAASQTIRLHVLYYQANINVQPLNFFPGRTSTMQISITYPGVDASVQPADRPVLVSWDGQPLAELNGTDGVSIELNRNDVGQHICTVFLPGRQRFAPATLSTTVSVARAAVTIALRPPSMVLAPFGAALAGTVTSQFGPVADAPVKVSLAGWSTTIRTGLDGSFQSRPGTGLSLSLFGRQDLQVQVSPTEEWNDQASATYSVVTVNVINIAVLLGLMALISVFGLRWRRRLVPTPMPGTAVPAFVPAASTGGPMPLETSTAGRSLYSLYELVLQAIAGFAAFVVRKGDTLREIASKVAPRLGPLGGPFTRLALLAERELYSNRRPSEADREQGERIANDVIAGVDHGRR